VERRQGKTQPTEQGSRKDGDNGVLVMARWQRRTDADDVAVNAWPGGGKRKGKGIKGESVEAQKAGASN